MPERTKNMKTSRLIALILSLVLAISVCFALASCGGNDPEPCTSHTDANGDGVCDTEGCNETVTPTPPTCTEHTDSDGNGICDTEGCGETVTPTPPACTEHTDADGDGVCDTEGCNEPVEPEEGDGTEQTGHFNENGELILFKDGIPTFTIIKGSDIGTNGIAIDELVTAINLRTSTKVQCLELSSEPTDVEILIGTVTNRGDEYKIDRHTLGLNGYTVKQVGTKIVVLGGSSDSLGIAIKHLKETVFNIKKAVEPFTDLAITADTSIEYVQDNYAVTGVTVDGEDLKSFTVCYPSGDNEARKTAKSLQSLLYEKTGIWLDTTSKTVAGKKVIIRSIENDGEGNGYEVYVDGEGNLIFESEFAYLLEELTLGSADKLIFSKKGKVALGGGALDTDDARNLYYEECGAVGDGATNDFEAIKLAHELANRHGHIVNGTEGAVYYIGSTGGKSATVMTDVNWNGCKFIFDDSIIEVHGTADDDVTKVECKSKPCPHCADRYAPIFSLDSGYGSVDVTEKFAGMSLNGGWKQTDNTQKIEGWDLDYLALVQVYNTDIKIFIRVGANADGGDHQTEYLLVHPDGTIDPSTPLSYDYEKVTIATAWNVDPDYVKPITIDGGGAVIETIANQPGEVLKSSYIQFQRNISVNRSNVTLKSFSHTMTGEGEYRCPYAGIIYTYRCSNVEYKDINLQAARRKWYGTAQQGTYEIGGYGANDILYYNVDVINFFANEGDKTGGSENAPYHSGGEIANKGCMGTNYCRNFYFEGCKLNTFDSHKGMGNATLKDCEFTNILVQGSGHLILNNVTSYSDLTHCYLQFRHDYGSSWRGDVTIRNGVMKYSLPYTESNPSAKLAVIDTGDYNKYKDNDFTSYRDPETGEYLTGDGCYNYNPVNITVEGFTLVRYTYTGYDIESDTLIGETEIAHTDEIYLYNKSVYGMPTKSIALLTSESSLGVGTQNRNIASETVAVSGSNVAIKIPDSLYFKDCEYTLDGAKMVWDTSAYGCWRAEEEE